MINSILKSTRGKPCSCPSGKICSNCKAKKTVHPKLIAKESRRSSAPEIFTYYKSGEQIYKQNPTVQYLEPKRWRLRKRQKYEPEQPKSTTICRWYKRRKALKQLIKEHEKEKEIERKRKRDEYERERMEELMIWEQQRKQRASSLPPVKTFSWEKTTKRHQSLPPPKRLVYIKEKSAIVKPRARSKYASAKQYTPRDSITKRFVNYCYRLCCQLYCYLTCILIIVFALIFIV